MFLLTLLALFENLITLREANDVKIILNLKMSTRCMKLIV
jgi:hypothetical protein